MQFDILTLFPNLVQPYLDDSIMKRAIESDLIKVNLLNWREFAEDKHKTVDDKPYGGGAGMLMKVEPLYKQLKAINAVNHDDKTRVIMMAPDGEQLTQTKAEELAKFDRVVMISGRYEGFDARILDYVDEKISIGPYVLAGGELPSLITMEAIARHIPGVLGHDDAMKDESFSHGDDYKEYPQYTRPEIWLDGEGQEKKVPEVLLSGDHAKIEEWKKDHS
jgi:tRNA (guanine37-N1)-methyltransferase